MSTVVVVTNSNAGYQQNQPSSQSAIGDEHSKKDSSNTRVACGALGTGALAAGVAGQFASNHAGDKFIGLGESGKIFDEKPMSILSPKSWGRAIKANPRAFLAYVGVEVASWTSILVGAALLQRAFTGHKAEKKNGKS